MNSLQSTPARWPDLLKQTFPSLQDIAVEKEIVQANAVGYIVTLTHRDDDDDYPKRVFVKQVHVKDYIATKKDWADLRRTLVYGRTEVRFYRDVAPLLSTAPRCFAAEVQLSDYLEDSVPANAPAGEAPPAYTNPTMLQGAWIVLECVEEDRYYQASPLSISQAEQCLSAVAQLHASSWGNVQWLEKSETTLSRASFALPLRNPKELAGLVDSWKHFSKEFGIPDTNLGQRVQDLAEDISNALLPTPSDSHCTLIHGDYKAMNVFLPKDPDNDSAILVDYASCGIGLGMSDVAMHIHHAVLPADLDADRGEEALVRYYHDTVSSLLKESTECKTYPWELAWVHYKLAVVDYFRFFLGRMWKDATHDSMKRKENNPNISNINRYPLAAKAFCAKVERYVSELETDLSWRKKTE